MCHSIYRLDRQRVQNENNQARDEDNMKKKLKGIMLISKP